MFSSFLLLFSRSVMSNSLRLYGLQHFRLPCPSLSLGVFSNSCSWSHWCHLTISSCRPLLLLLSFWMWIRWCHIVNELVKLNVFIDSVQYWLKSQEEFYKYWQADSKVCTDMILLHSDGVEGRVLTPSYENTGWKTFYQKNKNPKPLKLTKKDTLHWKIKMKTQWDIRRHIIMI